MNKIFGCTNYKEVKIGETFTSFEELLEVAYDVGVQLGRGHVKHIGAPIGLQIRRKQADLVASHKDELLQACQALAGQTVEAWQMFCQSLGDDLTTDH